MTTPGPPVATNRGISLLLYITSAVARVGFFTVAAMFAGPPAIMDALLTSDTAKLDTPIAEGWGLNTTLLPAASMPMELQSTVSLGLVEGVIAPITPKGPCSTSVSPRSPDQAIVERSSVPGVFSATRRCLMILCPTFPILVSATPISANGCKFSRVSLRMLEIIFSRNSRGILRISFCALDAASMASSMVS